MLFTTLFLLLVYTSFSFLNLPSVSIILCYPFLLYKTFGKLKDRDIYFALTLILFYLASVLLTPSVYESGFLIEKTKGLIQIILSVVGFICFIRVVPHDKLSRVLEFLLVFLCLGSFLEIIEVIKPLSDFVRSKAFVQTLYDSDTRDLMFSGHIRPKLFTAEPSHVSKAFFIFCHSWILLKPVKSRFFVAFILHIYMGWVQASPIILLSFLCLPVAWFFYFKSRIVKVLFALVFIASMVVSFLYRAEIQQIGNIVDRLERGVSGKADGSFHQRLFNPMVSAYDVMTHNPILGIGLTNKEYILNYSSLKHVGDAGLIVGNNGVFKYFIYFGLFGTCFLLFCFHRYLSNFVTFKKLTLFYVYFIVYNFMTSSLVTPRYWLFMALVFVCLLVEEKKDASESI